MAALVMMTMTVIPAGAEEASGGDLKDLPEYLWELSPELSDEEFITLAIRNFKFVQSLEPLVEEDSFNALYKASVHTKQKTDGFREEFLEAQNNLVMKQSVEDGVYFLWDADNMPVADGEEFTEEELDAGPLDGYGFIPLLVKCLLDDPAQAKGNLICVSGGGMSARSNEGEAYPAIEVFQDLGYNVFVLQRRIRPYSDEDIFMDMQRAIRIVRYYAEKEGWGGQDMIADCGWSGGAVTVMGAVNYLYGELNPTKYCSSYQVDEIDAVNSDTDVTMPIYGGTLDANCENPNLPALYTCAGTEDATGAATAVQELYDAFTARGVPARLDLFEGAGHGFGVGQADALKGTEECALWPGYADEFMQENLGYSKVPTGEAAAEEEKTAEGESPEGESAEGESPEGESPEGESSDGESAGDAELVEIPEEYTQVKVFNGTYGFGDAEITAATNDDFSKFFFTYITFGEAQAVEGTVDESMVTVTYDLTGFMGGDAQMIWDDAMASPEEWQPR